MVSSGGVGVNSPKWGNGRPPAVEVRASGVERSAQPIDVKKVAFAVDRAVKLTCAGAAAAGAPPACEGTATQPGAAGRQGCWLGAASISSGFPASAGEHATVTDSPRVGGRGSTTLNGVVTPGHETITGVRGVETGSGAAPLGPEGEKANTRGARQPTSVYKHVKGGGEVEGVAVSVAVGDGSALGDATEDAVGKGEESWLTEGAREGFVEGDSDDVPPGLPLRPEDPELDSEGHADAEGRGDGEEVPRNCTAPRPGPDTLVQSAPLAHAPLHCGVASPVALPKKPGAQRPEHAAVSSKGAPPYVPAGQGTGAGEPAGQ